MKNIKKEKKSSKKNSFNKSVRPKTEAILTAFIAIALIFFSTYLVHIKSMDSLEEEIKIGLKSNVMSAATTINGNIHQQFTKETKREDSLYLSEITPLESIRQNSKDIRYIYTNILIGDKVYFILNPSPQNDNDGDGFPDLAPALMEEYKDPAPELLKALKEEKSIVSNKYTDEWGIFISAYAPFYDSDGKFVGTLGMDLELNNFYKRLKPIQISFEKAVVIIIFIGFVIGLLIWYIRKHTLILLLDKKTNELKINNSTAVLENVYHENISILDKIKQALPSSELTNDTFLKNLEAWIKHIIQYQKSKISSKNNDLVSFELLTFFKGIERKLEEEDTELDIINDVNLPFNASGFQPKLYIETISVLLLFLKKITKTTSLKMQVSQIDESVNGIVLRLKLIGKSTRDIEGELLSELQPSVNTSDKDFNAEEFKIAITCQLLKQYQCEITSYSEEYSCGFIVDVKLSKPFEN